MATDLIGKRSGKAAGLQRPEGLSMPGGRKKGSSHLVKKPRKVRSPR